jgi:WD40 repeat protein
MSKRSFMMHQTKKYVAIVTALLLLSVATIQGVLLAQDSGLAEPINANNADAAVEFLRIGSGDSPLKRTVISPDGTLMAAATRLNQLAIWNINALAAAAISGQSEPAAFVLEEGHADTILNIAFSSDGALIASSGEDDRINIYDLAQVNGQVSGARRASLEIAEAANIVFSPAVVQDANGQNMYVMAALTKNADLRMWVIRADGVETLRTSIPNVNRMDFTADGSMLIATGNAGVVRFIGVAPVGEASLRRKNLQKFRRLLPQPAPHSRPASRRPPSLKFRSRSRCLKTDA